MLNAVPNIPYPPPSPQRSSESPGDHPNTAIFQILTDSSLSTEARCLGATMISMSWNRGYCWPSVTTQAEYLGRSISSVFRYHQELEAHGYMTIDRSGPSCNRYFPTSLSKQDQRDCVHPRSGRGARTSTGGGDVSPVEDGGLTGATLTPVRTTYENVKNVPAAPPRQPEWLEGYWDHLRQQNDENVVKNWPKTKEEAQGTVDSGESKVTAPEANVQVEETIAPSCNNLVTSTDTNFNAPTDPDPRTPDPEKVQHSSANSGDQVRDDHLARGKDIPSPKTEKVQEISATFENRDRGDRADHADGTRVRVRVPGEHGAGTRTHKIFDTTLLAEILDLTGDHKSKGCWIACVNALPEQEIRIAMSSLRQAMAETDVYRPGGYMLGVLRARNPEFSFAGRGERKHHGQNHDDRVLSTVPPPRGTRTPDPVRVPVVPPSPPEPPAPSIEDLVKGWRFASRSISIPRLLEIMKTSIGEVLDPSELWSQVKDICPGKDERTLVDRFFQVVTTRLRHNAAKEATIT